MFLAALAGCGNQGPADAPAPTGQQLAGAGLGFGPGSGGVIAFGGQQRSGRQVGPSAVTWRWTGARWQRAKVAAAPPARSATLLTADPGSHSLLMFGGEAETMTVPSCAPPAEPGQPQPCTGTASPVRVLSDTWAFTGRAWQQLAPGGDVPQQGQLLAGDPALDTVVLVGVSLAGTPMGEPGTWEWTGHRWSLLSGASPGGASPDGADSLGYGEASTIAVAINRGIPLATDDRKARRLCADRGLDLPTGTVALIRRDCEAQVLDHDRISHLLHRIRSRASFQAPRGDPDLKWWNDHQPDTSNEGP
jgi:hypothetical protein